MTDPMTQQSHENGNCEPDVANVEEERPSELSRKRRPWSSQDFKSILSPSPSFTESRRSSKDDLEVPSGPVTPRRTNVAPRGLSLQMPPRDISSTSTANLTKRIPVSPKPESSASYPSPASVLPRRSRGWISQGLLQVFITLRWLNPPQIPLPSSAAEEACSPEKACLTHQAA